MSADVVCMALGRVPSGEQRSRFLAVGLFDNTVRIISLDPLVSGTPSPLIPLPVGFLLPSPPLYFNSHDPVVSYL